VIGATSASQSRDDDLPRSACRGALRQRYAWVEAHRGEPRRPRPLAAVLRAAIV